MNSLAYVGIDAHTLSNTVCVLVEGQTEPVLVASVANDKIQVKRFFSKLSQRYELRCCYEAGVCGYTLQRLLAQIGVSCEVVAPSLVPRKAGDKVKTDRRDARKLAELYKSGQLTMVQIPTCEQESARSLVRYREALLRDLVTSKNHLVKMLTRLGLRYPGKSHWTLKHWDWLRSLSLTGDDGFVFEQYLELVEFKQDRVRMADERIAGIASRRQYKPLVERLCALRGVGILTAMTLVTEVIDFTRFRTARALMSYFGLVPREFSSGLSKRQGGITKTGSTHARRVLVEAAWKYRHKPALGAAMKQRLELAPVPVAQHSLKAQQRLHKKFWTLAQTKHPGKAAVAVARELAGFVWAVARADVALAPD